MNKRLGENLIHENRLKRKVRRDCKGRSSKQKLKGVIKSEA